MFESNDLEIKFATGEMSSVEEQVFLSKLSPSELERINLLRQAFSDLRTFRQEIPPMQLSPERLRVAIEESLLAKHSFNSGFTIRKMWIPVTASLALVGAIVFFNQPKEEVVTVATQGNVSNKSQKSVRFAAPNRGTDSAIRMKPKVSPKVVTETSPEAMTVATNGTVPKNVIEDNNLTAKQIFKKPISVKYGFSTARLDRPKTQRFSNTKSVIVTNSQLSNFHTKQNSLMPESNLDLSNSSQGTALTPNALTTGPESVVTGGGHFDNHESVSSRNPEIVIIVNNPNSGEVNEAVEVNHRVNIVIGS